MTSSQSSLANLWTAEDGRAVKPSPVKVLQSTPTSKVITVTAAAGANLQSEILKYYRDAGLANIAKGAGLVQNSNGTLGIKLNQTDSKGSPLNKTGLPVVAIPVSLASPAKMSPVQTKTDQPPVILPRSAATSHQFTNSPMILGTPTRLTMTPQHMLSAASSPRTPILAASPSLQQSWRFKRKAEFHDVDLLDSKRKKGEKGGKGLRHFSMKVCEKVQKKGVTSYNEVADELVQEFSDPRNMSPTDQAYDQKNIRRRVYDALNVLMAMNIISKEKKEIHWIGLPTNSAQECQSLEVERARRIERIRHKTQQLQELIIQQIAFKNLVQRNKEIEKEQGAPTNNSAIHLPFIIVNTNKKTVIDCSISNDKYEYLFNFDNTFEIHDDIEVLKRMKMAYGLEKGDCTNDNLKKAVKVVSKSLEPYVYDMAHSMATSGTSITAGPSGIKRTALTTGTTNTMMKTTTATVMTSIINNTTSAATTNSNDDDAEVAVTNSNPAALSRQSSVGSFSDLTRAATETPSEAFSDDDDEDSDIDDI